MMMMMMMMNDDDDDDGFHIALFSALEQTHCAFSFFNHVWLGMSTEVVVFYLRYWLLDEKKSVKIAKHDQNTRKVIWN